MRSITESWNKPYVMIYVLLFIEWIVLWNRTKNCLKKGHLILSGRAICFLTWETLVDRVGQNVVGHDSLTVCGSALSSDLYAGNGWKLLQPRIVEGVGWMVWHLRCDLQAAVISYQKRQQTCNKTSNEQYTTSKHMPAKDLSSIMQRWNFFLMHPKNSCFCEDTSITLCLC